MGICIVSLKGIGRIIIDIPLFINFYTYESPR